MRQLVGLNCVVCQQRIEAIDEGAFCPACSCPVHYECAQTNSQLSTRCGACGGSLEVAEEHQREEDREVARQHDLRQAGRVAGQIQVAVLAGALVALVLLCGGFAALAPGAAGIWILMVLAIGLKATVIYLFRRQRTPRD